MPRLLALALALIASSVPVAMGYSSFAGTALRTSYTPVKSSLRMENFGLPFAEDLTVFVPDEIFGEAKLKNSYVPGLAKQKIVDRPFLTEDYPILTRVAEMNLLTKTAEAGLLTALTEKGLTLSQVEAALPLLEQYGLLSVAVKNKQLFLNLIAPLLVEPAPLLLGPLAAVIKAGPTPPYAIAAALAAYDALGVANGDGVNIPLALLVVVFGGVGTVLSGSVSLPAPSSSTSTSSTIISEPVALNEYTPKGGVKGLRV